MKLSHDKTLILSLIKDDMINSKLVNGLSSLGLDNGNYFLHLSETIFKLMGFEDNEQSDEVYARHLELTKKAAFLDFSESHQVLDGLVEEVYGELVKWLRV